MNPANNSYYEYQAGKNDKKPFYHIFKPDFIPSFPFIFLFQLQII